ncbi:hypothetical protein TNIN_281111 [Trichonephila inaurata madagascariensis]|uniref:Uncharacterized protein n=1 Tax=Trichonephila inaurata madagascariensis TaxID=2747483 RepID=A0A8X7CR65_9ARAC|nr:hypothetical protein TNIN_281111 [Trichonephila inaurata madagascariensis]
MQGAFGNQNNIPLRTQTDIYFRLPRESLRRLIYTSLNAMLWWIPHDMEFPIDSNIQENLIIDKSEALSKQRPMDKPSRGLHPIILSSTSTPNAILRQLNNLITLTTRRRPINSNPLGHVVAFTFALGRRKTASPEV